MKTRRFARAMRTWESTWANGPTDDPAERWNEQLGEMTDAELITAGTWSDLDGLQSVEEDPDWRAEMRDRGLL